MKKNNFGVNLFLAVFMLIGLALLGAGIYSTVDRNKKMNTYESVKGGIVDYIEKEGEDGTVYGAVYAYTVGGVEYTFYDEVFTNKMPQIGESVQIMYDPAAPENAFAKGAVSTGFFLILLGGMFFAIPLFIFITSNVRSTGRWAESSQGFLVGLIFAGLGYGLCFGLRQGINFAMIFCFLFGSFGVFAMGYSVYNLFKPQKQDVAPCVNQNSDLRQDYDMPVETGQDDFSAKPMQRESGEYREYEKYGEHAGYIEYGKYEEKIERAGNAVRTGVIIARGIGRVIAGVICTGIGGFVISTVMNPNVEVSGMPRSAVASFFGIFVAVGVIQIIKGIKMISQK